MEGPESRSGHVIVCGVHPVALRTIEPLRAAGTAVVVVDAAGGIDAAVLRQLEQWGVPHVSGRLRDALAQAGLAGAVAVVCLQSDELQAMETALLVRRLRPDVRLVVRMDNAAVGRALREVTGDGTVLDVAALAAPSVVEVCVGTRTHAIPLAGREFLVAELAVERAATVRDLYGELAPLAVDARDGAAPIVCPGRDHPVGPGDRVTAIGTLEQFTACGAADVVSQTRPHLPARHVVGARMSGAVRAADRADNGGRVGLWSLLRSLLAEADRPLRRVGLLLTVMIAISVVVLVLGYVKEDGSRMTIVDAVYFTIETIATVGYGDFSFAGQETWLRVWAIGLMIAGTVLTAVAFALITQLLVSRRLERSFGHRRVGAMRGHVIVVGLGSVGLGVVEGLRAAARRVVVVERDEDSPLLATVRPLGVPVVIGDATDPAVLAIANLDAAAAVAVLTSDDLSNIETGLVVRDQLGDGWRRTPVVLRVFDRELGATVADGFGFRHVRSTAALAAPWFVGAALGLDVLGTFYVHQIPFLVGRLSVAPAGGLDGLAMGELSARTRVVAIHRSGDGERVLEYPPRRGTRFAAGDDAYLVGPYEELLQVLRRDTH